MSILIKGATKQQVMKVLINSTEWLPDNIEVIEIPTPHGRLIDADLTKQEILNQLDIPDEKFLIPAEKTIYKVIGKAPTVIEAEEDEENDRD